MAFNNQVFSDDLEGQTLSAYPAGWSTLSGARTWTVSDLSGNKVLRGSSLSSAEWSRIGPSDIGPDVDGEIIVKVRWTNNVSGTGVAAIVGLHGVDGQDTGAHIEFRPGNNDFNFRHRNNGVQSNGTDATSFTNSANTWYTVRLQYDSGTYRAKVWNSSQDEPVNWMFEYTSAPPVEGGGRPFIGCRNPSNTYYFDDVVYNQKGASPSVSGVITDENGTPCERTVYAVTRPTDGSAPEIVAWARSDPVTGGYELPIVGVPAGSDITRIVVAEDNGVLLLPDLVDRVIPDTPP